MKHSRADSPPKTWFAGFIAFFVVGFLVVERSPATVLLGLAANS